MSDGTNEGEGSAEEGEQEEAREEVARYRPAGLPGEAWNAPAGGSIPPAGFSLERRSVVRRLRRVKRRRPKPIPPDVLIKKMVEIQLK